MSAGVDDNETMKLPRNGGADPEKNQPGDLYVTIKVIQLTPYLMLLCCYICMLCQLFLCLHVMF